MFWGMTPFCNFFISQSKGGSISLTAPGQNTAEHCNFTHSPQINLSARLVMNLPEAEWPHSVALWHLMLEKLHPLKLGMHLHCLEICFDRERLNRMQKRHGGNEQVRCCFVKYASHHCNSALGM